MSSVTADTPLRPRQRRFVTEYLVDLNGTQAAIRAGYSAKTAKDIASQNLAKLNIKAAVAAGLKKQDRKTFEGVALTREIVLEQMRAEATFHGEGSSHSARVRANELLGREVGLFREQSAPPAVVNVNVPNVFDPSQLNDDQLAKLGDLIDAAKPATS